MTKKYNGIEKYIFADCYNFLLKYIDMQNTDYYWEKCIEDAKILLFKYHNHNLCRSMVDSTLMQIECVVKGINIEGLSSEQWNALSIKINNQLNK